MAPARPQLATRRKRTLGGTLSLMSDARTKLEVFFNILAGIAWGFQPETLMQS